MVKNKGFATTGALVFIGLTIIVGSLIIGGDVKREPKIVFGAPSNSSRIERTILPETDSKWELGTSTRAWLRVFTDELCLNGTCHTSLSSGGGGGVGWATTTADTESIYFYGNNYVGIGTTTPAYKLDVVGDIRSTGTGYFDKIEITEEVVSENAITLNPYTLLWWNGGSGQGIRGWSGRLAFYNWFTAPFRMNFANGFVSTLPIGFSSGPNAVDSSDIAFSRLDTNKIALGNGTQGDYSGTLVAGKVGIGDSSPDARLDIQVANATDIGLIIEGAASQSGDYVQVNSSTGSDGEYFVIESDGKVGISSTTPQKKLSVGGAIASQEVNLTDGATVTFDLDLGNQARVTLGGNRAFELSNETDAAGQSVRIILCQDGTGSRTITSWDSNIRWAGGSAPTLTTTANKCDVAAGFITMATSSAVVLLDIVTNF